MKVTLQESKEKLPLSFLTDFVSRGWESIGMLKQEIAAISEQFSGTKKIEDLLQALVDAYLICVGQIELHMQNKDYLDFPEEAKEESLKEDLSDKEKISEESEDDEIKAKEVLDVLEDKIDIHGEDDMITIAEKGQLENPEAPKIETEVTEDEFDVLAQEFHDAEAEEKNDPSDEIKEEFEYFCDFDEPLGEALTDADIYPEDK